GMRRARILAMWTSLMVITGLGAAFGALLLNGASGSVFALIEGIAAGAMLTMIAETMLPEAYHKGAGVVGLSTLGGFLAAIAANHVG
ncbi:MAG TPA: ZIP family zinc transporter, partial [Ornithinibacter sp.]|nr:ZIP family zinc transporter [Ornithinibacter sp.]